MAEPTKRTPTKRTPRKTASRRRVAKKAPVARAGDAAVEGTEQLVDALDTEIRLRFSAAVLIAAAIVLVLFVLTAAVSVNWLYAIVTIALAFVAGWLTCRSTHSH